MAIQLSDSEFTITIQAASDSVMTHNNETNGTALTDDDCRKMYGLPHTYTASKILYDDGEEGSVQRLWDWLRRDSQHGNREVREHGAWEQLVTNDSWSILSGILNLNGTDSAKSLRWDIVHAYSHKQLDSVEKSLPLSDTTYSSAKWITGGYGAADVSVTGLRAFITQGVNTQIIDRRPTTTPFVLRCNSINYSVEDQSTVTPLMGIDWGDSGASGQPEQLDNFSFNPGFKKETIKLQGVLIDNGPITADNPRRQTLLTIARTQYLKIRSAPPIPDNEGEGSLAKIQGALNKWGGPFGGPTNPRSYPCLTIFNRNYDSHDAGDDTSISGGVGQKGWTEPDGAYRIYRGVIKNLSFTMEAGRPDYWTWSLDFEVVANEKRSVSGLYDAQTGDGVAAQDSSNKGGEDGG